MSLSESRGGVTKGEPAKHTKAVREDWFDEVTELLDYMSCMASSEEQAFLGLPDTLHILGGFKSHHHVYHGRKRNGIWHLQSD